MKSGAVASSGSVSDAGTSATVNAAGNISIAAIVTGIVMTVAAPAPARTVLGLTAPAVLARTATIVTDKNARQHRAFFLLRTPYSPSASPTSR